jgi:hypothetical protein
MGANLAGALGSGINAATLEGQRQVGSLLGQRKAVAAGKQSLYDKYLAQAKSDALQNAQIRENNYLSASGLGLKQSQVDAAIRGQDVSAATARRGQTLAHQDRVAARKAKAASDAAKLLAKSGGDSKARRARNASLVNASQAILDRYMATKPADGLTPTADGKGYQVWQPDYSVPYTQIIRYLTAQGIHGSKARRIAGMLTGYGTWTSH